MKQGFDLQATLDAEKMYMIIAGFYPPKNLKYKLLYYLSAIFNTSISWLQFLAMATFGYSNLADLSKVSEILLFCMTQFAFLNKLTNFIANSNELLRLEIMLQNPLFKTATVAETRIIVRYVDNGRRIAKVYRVLCFLVVVFYAIFPFIDGKNGKQYKFPLPAWFPFDPNNYYYEVFASEILSIAVGAWINSNIDILTITMVILATALFEILKDRLRNILQSTDVNDGERIVDEALVQRKLRLCVVLYNDLLDFVSQIEKTFSKGIFIQFFCSVIVICLTGFQMLVISFNSMQFVLLIIYFSCMMCQIVMYCWYGHMIAESSDKITDACYLIEWNKCSVSIQKTLITIMERAKRPAMLRAGGFFVLNLPTLMTILRSSYSYFAVLQRVYSKN